MPQYCTSTGDSVHFLQLEDRITSIGGYVLTQQLLSLFAILLPALLLYYYGTQNAVSVIMISCESVGEEKEDNICFLHNLTDPLSQWWFSLSCLVLLLNS